MKDEGSSTGNKQRYATKTKPKASEFDDFKIVHEIEYTEPGSPQDQRLADEQLKAVLALLTDVAEARSRRGSIAQPAMDPIATTKSPTPPQAS